MLTGLHEYMEPGHGLRPAPEYRERGHLSLSRHSFYRRSRLLDAVFV